MAQEGRATQEGKRFARQGGDKGAPGQALSLSATFKGAPKIQ